MNYFYSCNFFLHFGKIKLTRRLVWLKTNLWFFIWSKRNYNWMRKNKRNFGLVLSLLMLDKKWTSFLWLVQNRSDYRVVNCTDMHELKVYRTRMTDNGCETLRRVDTLGPCFALQVRHEIDGLGSFVTICVAQKHLHIVRVNQSARPTTNLWILFYFARHNFVRFSAEKNGNRSMGQFNLTV